MGWRFDGYELRPETLELLRGSERVALEPTPLRLLAYLVGNRDRIVPRGELLGSLWPHFDASDASLERAVRAARRALGDNRAASRFIRTIHGQGYQFVPMCIPFGAEAAGLSGADTAGEPRSPLDEPAQTEP